MTEIDIIYTITREEYVESQTLYVQKRQRKQLMMIWFLPAALLVSLILVFLTNPALPSNPVFPSLLAGVVVSVVFALAAPSLRRRAFRKRFVIEGPNMTNAHVRISDSGFFSEVAGVGTSLTEWTAFDSWMEGKSTFVLLRGFTFRPIPKRVLTSTQIEEFRAQLDERIPPCSKP